MLTEHFVQYVKDTRGISQSSAKHYVQALNTINSLLERYNFKIRDVFTLSSIDDLDLVDEFLNNNAEYQEKDEVGHRMYSVAFKHYRRFILWYYQ